MIIDAEQGPFKPSDEPLYPPSQYHHKDVRPEIVARTPSPTPSEARALNEGVVDWKSLRNWRFWIRKEWIWYYVALVLICTITALVTIFHQQIVDWLRPVSEWLRDDFSVGWIVPIAVLFVISFPPLFGHEIVAVLCGLVWGLWIGFGIVCAGTFLGEVGNFYAFKYCCRARGEKLERSKIPYACLARVVREGGFKIALIARLSAIPGHFTTAVFSTCGMGIVVFSIAAILSMPKQFIVVYLGVILEQSASGKTDTKSRIISDVVIALTLLITVGAMWYIFRQMNKVKPQVIYDRRKARQAKLSNVTPLPGMSSLALTDTTTDNTIYPFASQSSIYTPKHIFAPKPTFATSSSYGKSSTSSEYNKPMPWNPYHASSSTHLNSDTPDDSEFGPLAPPGIDTPNTLPRTLTPGGGYLGGQQPSPAPPSYTAPSYPP